MSAAVAAKTRESPSSPFVFSKAGREVGRLRFSAPSRLAAGRRDARQSPSKAGREVGRLRFREIVFVR
jgi:hypothetical protein